MIRSRILLMIAGVTLVLAACSPGATGGPNETPSASPLVGDPVPEPQAPGGGDAASSGFAVDGGLSIPDALAYEGDQVVAVKGFIVRTDQTDALCELLAPSYPPQCGGAMLTIENPEAISGMGLQEAGGVQWSDEYVTVFGPISNGHLTIDTTVIG